MWWSTWLWRQVIRWLVSAIAVFVRGAKVRPAASAKRAGRPASVQYPGGTRRRGDGGGASLQGRCRRPGRDGVRRHRSVPSGPVVAWGTPSPWQTTGRVRPRSASWAVLRSVARSSASAGWRIRRHASSAGCPRSRAPHWGSPGSRRRFAPCGLRRRHLNNTLLCTRWRRVPTETDSPVSAALRDDAPLLCLAPPPPPRTTHLRAMRSTDSSLVKASSPTAGTHGRASDSSDPEPVVLGLHEEAYIEVQVGRLAAPGRNPVHVDVEDSVVERPHVESGLLARFAQRDREGIGVSVAVTTGLQRARELGVVREQHAVARDVHEPRRARDVADPAGTVETVGVRIDEGIEARDGRRLLRPLPAVFGEECCQCAPVHWTRRRSGPPAPLLEAPARSEGYCISHTNHANGAQRIKTRIKAIKPLAIVRATKPRNRLRAIQRITRSMVRSMRSSSFMVPAPRDPRTGGCPGGCERGCADQVTPRCLWRRAGLTVVETVFERRGLVCGAERLGAGVFIIA